MTSNCNTTFQQILNRVCREANTVKNKLNKVTCKIINAYAQTLGKTIKDPEETKKFYD